MLKRTHLLFGALLFLALNVRLGYPMLMMAFSLIGAMVPDLDLKFMHRKLLHNFWALGLAIIGGFASGLMNNQIATSFAIGFASHLLADSLTHTGIMPFWPLPKPRFRGPVTTGGLAEYALVIGISVAIACVLGIIRVAI
ncbi:MAG: metal-dependent hydrolase [Candidatus Aenigmatarchaeota archaeon]